MNMNRRFFLKSGSIALASFGLMSSAPSFLQRTVAQALSASGGRRKTLIAIFQRGAVDGLNMVVPYGESAYYDYRPNIAIPKPRSEDGAIDLDGFFGLHPALAPFEPLWREQRLAIVHAVGSPDSTRSHFDAQDYMETGTPGRKGTPDGWLNRLLQAHNDPHATPFRAVAMTPNMPRILQGRAPALAIQNLSDFTIRTGGNAAAGVQNGFEALYEQLTNDRLLSAAGKETFEAISFLKRVNPNQYKPANGAVYPRGRFGDALRQIAQLIKSGVGLEVAFTDIGGWDTHVNQGGARGQLAARLEEFSQGIAALVADLGPLMDDVVIVTMSEFGRTARENGNRGTDHGHANAMFVIGGATRGGRVYCDWPGLKSDQLNEGRDLALTTDFRDVFGELAQKHLRVTDLRTIFPGYTPAKFRGLLS
ncbi:MAG: DUF1501 domain-containing protein [Pyrinomonas methylaliphatogenes]|jgi:uncharacterized protein (DUF1501 family)|uniref:DUF1501 domain-containing protein n=2 Tax=Pyrinomonas methylaliphatogenes TaxID=454194 RepID=A0A0B6X076_9BACT|nr:DUF1501 domain-containing protein [Pyrinomonas methylaliphatogenes]CDM65949.1 hypothetical protein PYK22_01958 [Pyrinomonas methylaliphatogenes]